MSNIYRLIIKIAILFFTFVLSIQNVLAWGSTGHKIINRKAPMQLPSLMSKFKSDSLFYEAHASDADYRKVSGDTTFAAEYYRHYLDIDEYPNFYNLPRNLDSLIKLYGWDTVKSRGTNPWFTKYFLDSLTAQLARGDSIKVKQTASDLGHYVADGHQPLHCTFNYDGQFTGNNGIHSRYETTLLDYFQSQIVISPASIQYVSSPIDYIFEYIYYSQSFVDSIMLADNYAKTVSGWGGSGTAPASYYNALWERTQSFTKDMFQRATVALASLWYTAYVNAGLLSITIESVLPEEYSLSQNYPNPFNPATIIKYQLPEDSRVNLSIYDLLGREAATLVNEVKKMGSFEVEWNASNLSSGVYICRFSAIGLASDSKQYFTDVKKMLLVR
ncbi:MAG: T9SS type A sorting domain-containing protein [Bacteroidetes bacterium]|nr:T9SS type A sorting domain-containing protein [Bacteroidota bacterium]